MTKGSEAGGGAGTRRRRRLTTRKLFRHTGRWAAFLDDRMSPQKPLPEPYALPREEKPPGETTILVVDDQASNRVAVCRLLSKEGYVFETAADAQGAWTLLENKPDIDLVLLDIYMPGMDGVALTQKIRKKSSRSDVGIILLSASEDTKDVVTGLDSGADDFISKPVVKAVLLARMRSVLRLRQMETVLRHNVTRLRQDLIAAQELQLDLIPQAPLKTDRLRADWRYIPSRYVGGDMLGVSMLTSNRLGFYLADVSGHGAAAAMLAAWVHHFMRPRLPTGEAPELTHSSQPSLHFLEPDRVLRRMDLVLDEGGGDRYLTAVYGVLELESGKLRYSIAGHPRPLRLGSNGEIDELDVASPPVGLGMGIPFKVGEVTLEPGQRLLLYTDGITEARNPDGEMFARERLEDVFAKTASSTLEKALDTTLESVIEFSQKSNFEDDVTLLALELLPRV